MLAQINSATLQGLEAMPIKVEVDAYSGGAIPRFTIVGLPDSAVKESQERILAAIRLNGLRLNAKSFVVNLAPADLKKEGSGLDLPIAMGILASSEILMFNEEQLASSMFIGELGLDGAVLPVKGALPISIKARKMGLKTLFVPKENEREAAVVDNLTVYGINTLQEIIDFLLGNITLQPTIVNTREEFYNHQSTFDFDFEEVRGQENVKRAPMSGNSGIVLGCITYMKELYGGSRAAELGGDVNLTITSGHFDRVFGGNNISGNIKGTITLNIEETGCHPITIGELYGGGNYAPYSVNNIKTGRTDLDYTNPLAENYYRNYPKLNIKSFTSIGRVFGGGLVVQAVVTGNPTVNINEVMGYRTAYTPWNYPGTTINYSDGTSVTLPTHTANTIGSIGTVFGGGNAAKVEGNTYVNIGTAGTIDFNSKIEGESSPRTDVPVVGADIQGNVYGGGNKAKVTGNTNVTIGEEK